MLMWEMRQGAASTLSLSCTHDAHALLASLPSSGRMSWCMRFKPHPTANVIPVPFAQEASSSCPSPTCAATPLGPSGQSSSKARPVTHALLKQEVLGSHIPTKPHPLPFFLPYLPTAQAARCPGHGSCRRILPVGPISSKGHLGSWSGLRFQR